MNGYFLFLVESRLLLLVQQQILKQGMAISLQRQISLQRHLPYPASLPRDCERRSSVIQALSLSRQALRDVVRAVVCDGLIISDQTSNMEVLQRKTASYIISTEPWATGGLL